MTTLAQVFAEANHSDMTQLGPATWAELHAWADRFAAKVGDSCGCGAFAQDAAHALHDLVNLKLGKKAMYPETLREVTKMYQDAARKTQKDGVDGSSPYTMTRQFAWAAATDAANQAMRKGRRSAWSLEDYNLAVRTFEELWPETVHQEHGIYPWPDGMFDDEEEEADEGMEQRKGDKITRFFKNRLYIGVATSQKDSFGSWEDVTSAKVFHGKPDLGFYGDEVYEYTVGQWQNLRIRIQAEAKRKGRQFAERTEREGQPLLTSYPIWEHGLRPHLSQSFIDTILHTAVGSATALAVTKALTPTSNIKEGEKPSESVPSLPPVLSPAHVEGDQANVDLGTLLEEIDAILKKPETMGIVDADTLTIVRK